MATRIQVRRDSAANWTSNNPTLADGEIGFETDTGLLKVGKSNTPWISLEYTQDSLPSYELYAKIQNFDPNTYPSDGDTTNEYDMEIGDVLVLDADTTNSAFALGDRVRANSVSEREYIFTNLSSALFNSASASIRTSVYNEETQQDDVTPGDTLILTTTNPNLAIKVGTFLTLYRNTDPIFGSISVEVKSISSNKLTYTCELTQIDRTSIDDVPQEFTATSWNALFSVGSSPGYHYPPSPAFPVLEDAFDEGDSLAGVIPYAYLEGVITGLNANSASITIDNLGPSGAPYWFENMKISLAPGRDGLGYGYNVARNPNDPALIQGQDPSTDINFATIDIGSDAFFYDYLPGAYSVGDNVRVTFPNDSGAGILEGSITYVNNYFSGYLQISVSKVVSRGDSLSIPQSGAKVSLKGQDGADLTFATAQTVTSDITSDYTLQLSDAGKFLVLNASSLFTLSIPTNASVAIPVGTRFDILQKGTGQVLIDGATVTIYTSSGIYTRTQYSGATLIKIGTDEWSLVGDLTDTEA